VASYKVKTNHKRLTDLKKRLKLDHLIKMFKVLSASASLWQLFVVGEDMKFWI
jgi:hypothetical protein